MAPMDIPSRRKPAPWTPPADFPRTIDTPRLSIRLLRPDDAEDFQTLVARHRQQLLPWMDWAHERHRTVGQTSDHLKAMSDALDTDGYADVLLGVFDRAEFDRTEFDKTEFDKTAFDRAALDRTAFDRVGTTPTLVGALSVHGFDTAAASAEIGYWIASPHTRRGLATEAVRHLISAALTPADSSANGAGWGLNKVHAESAGANAAARGVAKALRLRREMRRRQHVHIDTVGVDDVYGWAVLADEWDTASHRLKRDERDEDIGVGPHLEPWPQAEEFDPLLLRDGDRRNVADRFRYWRHDAIVADLAAKANPFHVAIENWRHDNNIGTVVRNANAFGAAGVHVVGRRSWNRRGAMVTDRYLTVHHHDDFSALQDFAREYDLSLVGIDNLPGSVSIFTNPPPQRAILVMGQEGPGLSEAAREAVSAILFIPQFGSTRSINAGVASGIAMAEWVRAHIPEG